MQSKFLAVGSLVPWVEAEVGAVATQAHANVRYGPDGLAMLRQGFAAEEVVGGAHGRRHGPGSSPARRRRLRGRERDLHGHGLPRVGRRHDRSRLCRAGQHPRLTGDGRGARAHLRGERRQASGRAASGRAGGRPVRRRRSPGSAVGSAPRRPPGWRLRGLRHRRRPAHRRPRGADRRARAALRPQRSATSARRLPTSGSPSAPSSRRSCASGSAGWARQPATSPATWRRGRASRTSRCGSRAPSASTRWCSGSCGRAELGLGGCSAKRL